MSFMKKKLISLIEDDVDGVTVIVAAPTQEMLTKDSTSLWETFSAYRNKNYPEPSALGLAEFNDDGGLDCTFNVSYPINIAREIVEDWLSENSQISEKDSTEATYSYW